MTSSALSEKTDESPPEVKKLADKYCDENGGPPKKGPEPLVGVDFAGAESQTVIWYDEAMFLPPISWEKFGTTLKIRHPPKSLKLSKLPKAKEKPWLVFNPTPKNLKRGPR